jgi:hypothetical protein
MVCRADVSLHSASGDPAMRWNCMNGAPGSRSRLAAIKTIITERKTRRVYFQRIYSLRSEFLRDCESLLAERTRPMAPDLTPE